MLRPGRTGGASDLASTSLDASSWENCFLGSFEGRNDEGIVSLLIDPAGDDGAWLKYSPAGTLALI